MILASASPRRKELLGFIVKDFKVIPAVGEELIPAETIPADAVSLLACQKAEEIYAKYKNETIIGADTVVVIDGHILGKPHSEQEAFEMLSTLSGRIHSVFTGVCIIFMTGEQIRFTEETKVEFYSLSKKEILEYIDTGDPMDKAGAYGIQEKGAFLVKGISGDFYNVMGLPIGRIKRQLEMHNCR